MKQGWPVCGLLESQCPARVPALAGSVGVMAAPWCAGAAADACRQVRFDAGALSLGCRWTIAGQLVIACDAKATLRAVRPAALVDIFPALAFNGTDMAILVNWINDYHRRRHPWALVLRGKATLALWKLRRV